MYSESQRAYLKTKGLNDEAIAKVEGSGFSWAQLLALIEQLLPILIPLFTPPSTQAKP